MERIGTISRLQVQTARLKPGEKPRRRFDPAPILAVPELALSVAGAVGRTDDGRSILDVHHRDHPDSRNRADNGVSIGFTTHYEAMRARFGDHLTDGIAGENILVQVQRQIDEFDLLDGVVLETADFRWIRLEDLIVAEPCVEFSRFALRRPDDTVNDETVAEALRFLRGGMRGFYATYRGEPAALRLGARVYLH